MFTETATRYMFLDAIGYWEIPDTPLVGVEGGKGERGVVVLSIRRESTGETGTR